MVYRRTVEYYCDYSLRLQEWNVPQTPVSPVSSLSSPCFGLSTSVLLCCFSPAFHGLSVVPVWIVYIHIWPDQFKVSVSSATGSDTQILTHRHTRTHACRWIKYDLLSSQLIHFYIIFLFFLSFSFRYIIKPFNFYVFPKPFNRTSPDIKFICQVRPCHVQAVALRLLYLTVYMKTFVFSEFQYWLSGQSGLWLQQGLLSWWVDLMTPDSHILSKCWGGGTLQQYSTLTDLHLNSILIVNSF